MLSRAPYNGSVVWFYILSLFTVMVIISATKAPGIHDSWCHLSLPWLVQSKPGLVHWACTGQAKARIDGARSRVYLVPKLAEIERGREERGDRWGLSQ